MKSNKTKKANKKQTKTKSSKNRSISCEKISKEFEDKFFKGMNMDIKEDFIDPFDNICEFENLEKKMFQDFHSDFGLLLDKEKKTTKNNKKENKNKTNIKEGTMFSKVYTSSYSNINGKEHEEKYQSQSIKQMNNGHNISECKEAYKNSDGICKSSVQRGLDKKGEKLIKEKNVKAGHNKEHHILKGVKENEINEFEKEYNDYSKKVGFDKNIKYLNSLDKKSNNKNLLTDGTQRLNKKTKRH